MTVISVAELGTHEVRARKRVHACACELFARRNANPCKWRFALQDWARGFRRKGCLETRPQKMTTYLSLLSEWKHFGWGFKRKKSQLIFENTKERRNYTKSDLFLKKALLTKWWNSNTTFLLGHAPTPEMITPLLFTASNAASGFLDWFIVFSILIG